MSPNATIHHQNATITRLWLQDELVIDATSPAQLSGVELLQWATLPDKTVTGKIYMSMGTTLRLRLEYLHHGDSTARTAGGGGGVRAVLGWESAGTPLQTVPPFVLYPRGEEIVGSPWRFTVA